MSLPATVRLRRGVPTRVQADGREYSLGINAVHDGGRSARIGVFVAGVGETTEVQLGSSVHVGAHAYAVSEIDDRHVVLALESVP
jgi:hypothetical protein